MSRRVAHPACVSIGATGWDRPRSIADAQRAEYRKVMGRDCPAPSVPAGWTVDDAYDQWTWPYARRRKRNARSAESVLQLTVRS